MLIISASANEVMLGVIKFSMASCICSGLVKGVKSKILAFKPHFLRAKASDK